MGFLAKARAAGASLLKRSRRANRLDKRRRTGRLGRPILFESLESRQLLTVAPLTLADPSLAGISAFGDSSTPTMSADGQLIAFQSTADNLVPNDANHQSDVFVYNRASNSVTLASVALDGTAAGNCNGYSAPVISPDGRYIAFECSAGSDKQLVSGRWGDEYYLRDLISGTTTLLTPNVSGNGNGCASVGVYGIIFTADSKHVLFVATEGHSGTSSADIDYNLTADQVTPGHGNIYERNLDTNQTKLVSADLDGKGVGISPGGGVYLTVNFNASADGRFVTFISDQSTFVANDLNTNRDVFVRDVQNGTTALVSGNDVDNTPATGDSGGAIPTISADGRYVTFVSDADNLTTVNPNSSSLAYVRDMQTGVTTAISVKPDNTIPSWTSAHSAVISADGRIIVFSDTASLLPLDTNGNGNGNSDVYAYDQTSHTLSLVSVNAAGTNGANDNAGTWT
jgi:Tol biopolymer transport system component